MLQFAGNAGGAAELEREAAALGSQVPPGNTAHFLGFGRLLLKDSGAENPRRTVRGTGYRFESRK